MLDARLNLPVADQSAASKHSMAASPGGARVRQPEPDRKAAFLRLKRTVPGLAGTFSTLTGGPALLEAKAGALSPAAAGRKNEDVVRRFLREHGEIYGFDSRDVDDLVVLGDSPGGTSGLRLLRMEQRIDGVPVFQRWRATYGATAHP